VRLLDAEGEQVGIVPLADAQRLAEEVGLDLVEIAPQADPPVCRVMDYGKFRFQQSKKQHEAKKKQKQTQVKEMKFRPGTDIGDYNTKMRKLKEFVEAGDRVKVVIRFRGREFAHQYRGAELLGRVEKDLEELASVEQRPKMEGRQMVMVLAPKK
jgi:translation initiation factor IF-3